MGKSTYLHQLERLTKLNVMYITNSQTVIEDLPYLQIICSNRSHIMPCNNVISGAIIYHYWCHYVSSLVPLCANSGALMYSTYIRAVDLFERRSDSPRLMSSLRQPSSHSLRLYNPESKVHGAYRSQIGPMLVP